MNKKFLSAILFGALMVTSTGTFVSCKDYDDDIDRIDNSLKDLKSQLDALQTKVDAGKYVTNVETTTSGITIHLSDGSSYPITNGKDGDKGEAGAAGDKVEINDDGFFIINGKATDWKAVAKDATGEVIKIKTPTISEDGCWVFYDEKGEAHPTTIKVAPVTAVQNAADQSWTLTVWDANGKSQTIKLPTAASLLTELDLAGWANFSDVTKDFSLTNNLEDGDLTVEYAWVEKIINYDNKETTWSAQKEVTKHQVLTTLAPNSTKLVARIAPAELDPSTLKFTLQDSKGNVLPIALGTPQKFTGALTRGASSSYAFIPMDVTADTYDAAKKYTDLFPANRVYSLVEASNYRSTYSEFTIKTSKATVTEQNVLKVDGKEIVTGETYFEVDLGKANKLTFGKSSAPSNPEWVYDYYVEPVDETVAELFGYSADKKNGTFTLAKSADKITKAPLELYVYALHIDGKIYRSKINVKPSSRLVDEVVLNAGNVTIAKSDKTDKLAFTISLADMFTSLGTDNTKVWQSSTLGAKANKVNSVKIGDTPKTVNEEFVWIKADGKATNNIYEAASVKVYVAYTPALSVAKEYAMAVDFKNASDEVLNSVKIKFTPVLPALSNFLVKKTALWNDDASVLMAYFNDPASTVTAIQPSSYNMAQGFTIFGNANAGAVIALNLDADQKLANDKYVVGDNQATMGVDKKTITLNTTAAGRVDNDQNKPVRAYGKELNVKVGITYLGVYNYKETDANKAELAAANFKVNVQSALVAGTIKALEGASIVMEPAAAGEVWKVTAQNVGGYTYSNQAYSLFKIATAANTCKYKYSYIQSVTFATPDKDLYTVVDAKGDVSTSGAAIDPVWDDNKESVASYVALKPGNTTQEVKTTLNVTVTDMFGYSKSVPVSLIINAAKK